MDLGPIPNFGALTPIQPQSDSPELPAVYRVENSSRAGGHSANRKPSPARQDSEFAEHVEEPAEEAPSNPSETGTGSNISFFA